MELILKYFSDFTPEQNRQLSGLKEIYTEWNQKINVISRKDMDNFYLHHVLHSLAIAAQFNFSPGSQVLDLGTGGGFPGVPLAIIFPETNFVLADSINKKLTVVNAACESLEIKNVITRHTRAEDIRDLKFDAVVSRAVAPLNDLWQWSRPLLKKNKIKTEDQPNGLVCLKGGDLSAEVQESGCRPFAWELTSFFEEEWFNEKFLLYVPL